MLDSIIQDLRFAFTLLLKNLKFSLIILFCLVLGIGPNALIFSVINRILLTPPDVYQPTSMLRLGGFEEEDDEERLSPLSYPQFDELRRQASTLSGMTAVSYARVSAVLPEGADLVTASLVSSEFFEVLDRDAMLGKVFRREVEEYPGAKAEIVLGYYFWRDRLGADPAVIDSKMIINGTPMQVLGVMAPSFTGALVGFQPDFFVPLLMADHIRPDSPGRLTNDSERWLMCFGRMAEGRDFEQVRSELKGLSKDLFPVGSDVSLDAKTFDGSGGYTNRMVGQLSPLVMGVVGMVLLVACTSVAALLLARSTERRREISVRLAMGATRRRLIRMLLTESMMLALIAGTLSLLVTLWSIDLFLSIVPINLVIENPLDLKVLGFTTVVSLLAGFIFGLAPALQTTRPDLIGALKGQPVNSGVEFRISQIRGFFVIAQFALSVFLLIIAVLFVRGLFASYGLDPGFDTQHLINFEVQPARYGYSGDRTALFAEEIRSKLADVPGIRRTAIARLGPLPTHRTSTYITPLGEDLKTMPPIRLLYNYVGPDFFNTMGMEILEGRAFQKQDRTWLDPVIIVNETLAAQAWPGKLAVGQYASTLSGVARVVGIARDARYYDVGEQQKPYLYYPIGTHFNHELSVILACEGDPATLMEVVRSTISDYDSNIVTSGVLAVDQVVKRSLSRARMAAILFGVLGLLALIMAVTGVYGVMSYSVNLRQQEIGIRMALGARTGELILLLMRRGLIQVGIGTLTGLVLALIATRFLGEMLSGVNSLDPLTFLLVPLLLGTVAVISIMIPAYRTTGLDPMESLRYE